MQLVLGMDEVGRGALAGPFVVGAVGFSSPNVAEIKAGAEALLKRPLADSKKLSQKQRELITPYLQENLIWSLGEASAQEIDNLGLAAAAKLACQRAIDPLRRDHEILMIECDGGLFHPYEPEIPTTRHIKGDETIMTITCASIIAKVYRDQLMREKAKTYPEYEWNRNVGYGSRAHRASIQKQGASAEHRQSFIRNSAAWDLK